MTEKKGPGKFVEKEAFVMPEIPAELGIDPLLAGVLHTMTFLELSDDETVDLDWAVEAMEHVAYYLQRMPEGQVAEVKGQLDRLLEHARKKKQPSEFVAFIESFLEAAGVIDEEAED